jgi:hypothetical protein
MGLGSAYGFSSQPEAGLQTFQSRLMTVGLRLGARHPVKAADDEFLKRDATLCRDYLGAVQDCVGEINCGFHVES